MGLSLAGFSMPIIWWGLLLIMYFSVHLRQIGSMFALPVSGRLALEFDVPATTGFMLIWVNPGEPCRDARKLPLRVRALTDFVLGHMAKLLNDFQTAIRKSCATSSSAMR